MVFRDVTDKRKSEQALRESQALVQAVLNGVPDPIFVKDRESRVLLANPATLELIGKPAEQVLGKKDTEFYDEPEVGRAIIENDRRVMETGQAQVIEERVIQPGEPPESERIFLSTKTPYRDAEGQVIGILGIAREITERKQRERKLDQLNRTLRESEERYRGLFEGMTEGFALHEIVLDENGVPCDYRFLELNPAFARLTGLAVEEVKGKRISEIEQLRGEGPRWVELYGKVALTGEPIHFESESPALGRYYEIFAYSPTPLQFAVIFMDITERKKTEMVLRQARETAEQNKTQIEVQHRLIEQREQERQRIAHDLHDGPVQTITGLTFTLQQLSESCPDPDLAKALEGLRDALQEVIGDLRAYTQELRPPILFNFGLRRAIRAHLNNFSEGHPAIQIHLNVEWDGEMLPEPVSIALFRVYQESLNNVVKHARASEVWVNITRGDSLVTLVVEDNGAGFQVPLDPLQLVIQGHLGLAGMRERVEAIGGSLEVDSRPGKGTRIQVQVPLG